MSFFSPKKESEVALVIDIGSGSVGGALVLLSRVHAPTVLYTFRSEIPFQEEVSGLRLLSLMLQALTEVVTAVSHEGFTQAGFGTSRPTIRETTISLSAPFVVSKTSFLRLHNEKPTKITAAVFESLLEHAHKETLASGETILEGSTQIEQKLIQSTLNGYETSAPYGKTAQAAEFVVFEGYSLLRVTEKIHDILLTHVHSKHVSFHSFELITFIALRELYSYEKDFLLADISGEQTEFSMIRKGVPVESLTFPFGRNHIARILMKDTSIPHAGASSFFKLYANDTGTGKMFDHVRKIFTQAMEKWRSESIQALAHFSTNFFLPKIIFVTADEEVLPIFQQVIELGDFSSLTIPSGGFKVIPLNSEHIAKLVRWNSMQKHDPFIALIASFANRLLVSKNSNQ